MFVNETYIFQDITTLPNIKHKIRKDRLRFLLHRERDFYILV